MFYPSMPVRQLFSEATFTCFSLPYNKYTTEWGIEQVEKKIFYLWYKVLDMGFIPFRLPAFLGTLKPLSNRVHIPTEKGD